MQFRKTIKLFVLAGLFVITQLQAKEISPEVTQLLKGLNIPLENVRTTPAKGLYEVKTGTQLVYITADGKYLLTGSMVNLVTKENLTNTRMNGIRLDAIKGVTDENLLSFVAKDQQHQVTVFTDIDCGYCRKLHAQMADYNKLGITVKYLFFPRTGIDSESYRKAVSVWCNKDRLAAMTDAKAGKSLPVAKCDNPIASHMQLGVDLGVSGTPYMVTEQGEKLPGYLPPKALKKELDQLAAEAASHNISRR